MDSTNPYIYYVFSYILCHLWLLFVTGQGPGPEWVCLGPVVACGFLILCKKDFTTRVQVTVRIHLLKLETVKQGNAQHRRTNRKPQAGLPQFIGKSEQRGSLGTGSGDQPGMSCELPIALEFEKCVPGGEEVGEEKGKENSAGCSQRETTHPESFVLRLLSLSCRQESQARSQGSISAEQSSVLQACPFRVMVTTDWSVTGQGSLVIAVAPGITQLVLLLFWAWS